MSIDLNAILSQALEAAVTKGLEPIYDQLAALRKDITTLDEAAAATNRRLHALGHQVEEKFDDSALSHRLEGIDTDIAALNERIAALNVADLNALVVAQANRLVPEIARREAQDLMEDLLENEVGERLLDRARDAVRSEIGCGAFNDVIGQAVRDIDMDDAIECTVERVLENGSFSFSAT